MGKSFNLELNNLEETYSFCLETPIDTIVRFIKSTYYQPLLSVGSGGSFTSATLASLLHQVSGAITKPVTPLQFYSMASSIRNSSVMLLTASGQNHDTLNAFRFAVKAEPLQIMSICAKLNSQLSILTAKYRYSSIYEMELPNGKDGFLATNSLLATSIILIRGYQEAISGHNQLPQSMKIDKDWLSYLNSFGKNILEKKTWIVLYSGWGYPAAIDLESKCSEASLCNIQLVDYRNFAHGRHLWLSLNTNDTGIIALTSPNEIDLANETINYLPKAIPVLKVNSENLGPIGFLELLLKVFYLVYYKGLTMGIDPGNPVVPDFGRRLYNLNIPPKLSDTSEVLSVNKMQNISIARKTEPENSKVLNEKHLNAWVNAYRVFKNSFNKVHFDTIVFDYDGTLCDPSERFVGVSNDIAIELIRLLEAGIIVGIATGRGKSVRADLQRVIPKNFWENIFIGYYNGGEVSHLLDSNCPNNLISLDSKLSLIQEALSQNYEIQELAVFETRPKQISITPKNPINWLRVRKIVLEISGRLNIAGIKVVESSHSIDVLAENVSKLNLVLTCKNEAIKIGRLGQVLCIGDRGDFVGNDFEMLSTPYSLSVHLVSADPISCWNFSPPGYRGVQSTLYYLKKMKASNKQFNIKFGN